MKRLVPMLRDVWPSSSGAFQMKKSQPFMVSTYSLQLTSAYLTCLHQRWLTNRHQEIIAQGARPDLSDKRSLWSCWDYCWSPQVGPVSWESHHLTLATEKKTNSGTLLGLRLQKTLLLCTLSSSSTLIQCSESNVPLTFQVSATPQYSHSLEGEPSQPHTARHFMISRYLVIKDYCVYSYLLV